jgi:hypothetical protein
MDVEAEVTRVAQENMLAGGVLFWLSLEKSETFAQLSLTNKERL